MLGYRLVDGEITIVPEETETVRRIFELYYQGYGMQKIANIINEEGHRTIKGREWRCSKVRSILQNEKYRGDAKLQKCFTTSFLDHKMQKNTGQLPIFYVSENHPAIIKPEVFEMVQEEFRRCEAAGGRAQAVTRLSNRRSWNSQRRYPSWPQNGFWSMRSLQNWQSTMARSLHLIR